jgi:polysaccharide biosynthesis protein PslG
MPDMTKTKTPIGQILFLIVLLCGCIPQTPIPVYVTPTHDTPPTETSTVIPTVSNLADSETAEVSNSVTSETTDTPVIDRSSVVITPENPQVTVTFMGAVVGPGYTPPPSFTPRPTQTPTEGPASPTKAPTSEQVTEPPQATAAPPTPSGPQPTVLPGLDISKFGIQVHSLLDQKDWDEVLRRVGSDQLHVGWVKVQIDWSLLQPNSADEITEDFRRQELYIESLDQRGIKVLVSIAKAPPWARSNHTESGPPDDPQALVNFLKLMLGEFGDAIDAVEVWNEANLQREWQGQPLSGGSYMSYFGPAHDAIRAYSDAMLVDTLKPRSEPMIIVTGGLAPTGTSSDSMDDRTYLQQMYDAGLGRYSDVMIGVHPYSWGNPPDVKCCNAVDGQGWDDDPHFFFANTMDDYRQIMTRNNHADSDLWVTEFGWATWEGFPGDAPEAWITYNDKWAQANYTIRAFEIGQTSDYIGPMFLWNLNWGILPGMVDNRDERTAYSLLVPLQPSERPLYWMLYDAVRPDIQLDRYD